MGQCFSAPDPRKQICKFNLDKPCLLGETIRMGLNVSINYGGETATTRLGTKTLGRERRQMKPRIVVAAAPSASATLFRKWMFLQPRSRHSAVLHPPYYYRRYFGSHTDHSLLSLVPCPISPRLGSLLSRLLARSSSVRPPLLSSAEA